MDNPLVRCVASASKHMPLGRPILSCLLCLTLCAPLLPAQSQDVQSAFARGAAALHSGHNAEAEAEFRRAIQLAPNLPEAHLDLGLVLGREGKQADAVDAIDAALKLDPNLPSANMFRGIFLYQMGHFDQAVDALRREVDLNSKNVDALTWLGIVELAAGHPELAVGPLDSAVALNPDDLNLLEYRGRAHSLVARDSYAKMAQINPNAWQVHKVRAELFVDDNRDRDAITEYNAAIALEPKNPDLYEGAGDAYRRLNDLDSAQKAYAKELELSPNNPIAMYDLGSTDVERGDYAAGVPLLKAMLSVYQDSPVAEYYLGRGLAQQGQNDEAAKWLTKSAHDGNGGEVSKRSYYELARLYRKQQKLAESQAALAEYNRLRAKDEKQSAAQLADWRKLNAPQAVEPAEPSQKP